MIASIRFITVFILVICCTLSCDSGGSDNGGNGNGDADTGVRLDQILTGNSFDRPLDLQNAGDGSNRLFIVEQRGVIHVTVFPSSSETDGTVELNAEEDTSIFLDLRDRVFSDQGESGLLGLAFHPDFEKNGYLYVNYTAQNPARTVISRFSVSDDPDRADPDSELAILEFPQPKPFHNGGQLAFGPEDGNLYISVGDGSLQAAADGDSQDLTSLLGSILRIDVDSPQGEMNYGIPADNPFTGNDSGFREEIYAYGFRNPWRMTFDDNLGTLFAGDVGLTGREEIDVVERGKNYGWNIMEGTSCLDPPADCDMSGLELPVLDYGRDVGTTVIAGAVYRGSEIHELFGKFVYGDFGSGRIWALGYDGLNVTDNEQIAQLEEFSVTAFGTDEQKELYICTLDGSLYRVRKDETARNSD